MHGTSDGLFERPLWDLLLEVRKAGLWTGDPDGPIEALEALGAVVKVPGGYRIDGSWREPLDLMAEGADMETVYRYSEGR